MSILAKIKGDVKRSGASKGKIIYFKADTKTRLRFLDDVDEGIAIPFHDSFELGINAPCQKIYGRECPYCGDQDLRHRDLYAWSVYDYEANEVKIFMAAANSFTPVPSIIGMYEEYGTIKDRDYVINRQGAQTNTSYSVIPMDKATFKNKKVKAFTEEEMLKMIDEAHPTDVTNEEEDKPKKSNSKAALPKGAKKKQEVEEDPFPELPDENDYENMDAKELYKECISRGIEVKPRKPKDHYIALLEEYDSDEGSDDDDWDTEEVEEDW